MRYCLVRPEEQLSEGLDVLFKHCLCVYMRLPVPFSQPLVWRTAAAAALHVSDSRPSDSGLREPAH